MIAGFQAWASVQSNIWCPKFAYLLVWRQGRLFCLALRTHRGGYRKDLLGPLLRSSREYLLKVSATNTRELALQDYVEILRRRWMTILAILVIAGAAAVAATFTREVTYQAQAEVLLRTSSTNQLFPSASEAGNRLVRQSSAEITFMRTDSYLIAAAEELGRSAPVEIALVADRNVDDTGRIRFTAIDEDPIRAADAAQTYAQAYINTRNEADIGDLERQLSEATVEQESLSAQLEALRGPVDEVDAAIADTTDPEQLSTLATQRLLIMSQLGADLGRLEADLSQAGSLANELESALADVSDSTMTAIVSSAASVPTSPISPGWLQNLLVALAVGIVLGIGAALLREALDTRMHSDDDIEALLGAPVMGHVAKMAKKDADAGLVIKQKRPDRGALEAYRKIRSSVMFLQSQTDLTLLQVTSPIQGNGKTTVSTNLAVAFAQQRQSVLLIDADMRRPAIHKRFGDSGERGLSAVLGETVTLAEAIRPDRLTGAISILPAGERPVNPSELLGSEAFNRLCKIASTEFDIVIIDSPPLLPVTDARLIASVADAVILVVDPESNRKRELTESVDFLHQARATVAGAVVNRVSEASTYGYNYTYTYNYE